MNAPPTVAARRDALLEQLRTLVRDLRAADGDLGLLAIHEPTLGTPTQEARLHLAAAANLIVGVGQALKA
ncbi:MAG: hypothetical protein E6J20_00245 [Chloroflexi bacterium]|nr:MAG: hypothetical protein E6J20_00245 [Chloroflexota bacterium]